MKEYLFCAGLVLVMVFSFGATIDINHFLEQDAVFDDCLEDCANASALYYDYDEYAEGRLVFKDDDANKIVKTVLESRYDIDGNTTRYLKDAFNYYVTIYDDTMRKRDYHNGTLLTETPFAYGLTDTDRNGEERVINSPTIIVCVNAGNPEMFLNFLDGKAVMCDSSAYVYQNDF